MSKYYLAIDIGASSGRHMLGSMADGKMQLEEVYRFANEMVDRNGTLCWDVEALFAEIKTGLKKCREIGKIPSYIAVDTWGVDFVLLDSHDNILGEAVGYRDGRNIGMDQKVYEIIPEEELYARTGIEKLIFNTIYQLTAVKEQSPKHLEEAEALLMTPDYLTFLLTGVKNNEYTIATTGQLVNVETNDWDYELIDMLGYPRKIFGPLSMPGTLAGGLERKLQEEVGFNCQVIVGTSHDTASAVLAVPEGAKRGIYLSSGTWSLMGIEREQADTSFASMQASFTNEGGYNHRYRYHRNIMGLWMIQSVKKEFAEELSYGEICQRAAKESISSLVDCNDASFMAPKSMIHAVQEFCRKTNQEIPETVGELAAVIYNSLAACYQETVLEIERITGKSYDTIYVVGGGANAGYLNELTAKFTGKKVSAGPIEATAIGNIVVQMLYDGVFADLNQARECIKRSFDIEIYDTSEKKGADE